MKNDKQMIVRVSSELKNLFNEHCKTNGHSVSKRLRVLIERDIDNGTRI